MIMIIVSTTLQALSSQCWPLQWNASSQWESEFFLLFHFNSLFFTVQASTMLYPVWHIIPKSGLRCQHLSATFGTPLSFLAHLLHIFLIHFLQFFSPILYPSFLCQASDVNIQVCFVGRACHHRCPGHLHQCQQPVWVHHQSAGMSTTTPPPLLPSPPLLSPTSICLLRTLW